MQAVKTLQMPSTELPRLLNHQSKLFEGRKKDECKML